VKERLEITSEIYEHDMSASEFIKLLKEELENSDEFVKNMEHLNILKRYPEEWIQIFAAWKEMNQVPEICKNCKYFTEIPTNKIINLEFESELVKEKFIINHGICKNENRLVYAINKMSIRDFSPNDKLFYIDNEAYGASLYVGVNFGCRHWEEGE
jgi:hypothetical protein